MSLLSEMVELCKYNQGGYCKFGVKCLMKHENEICINRRECNNHDCRKRHPKPCRYICQFGHCTYGEACAYSHAVDSKSIKIESMEKEMTEMREEMNNLKAQLSEKTEKEVTEIKEDIRMMKLMKKAPEPTISNVKGEQLEKGVTELKEEVSTLREMFGKNVQTNTK